MSDSIKFCKVYYIKLLFSVSHFSFCSSQFCKGALYLGQFKSGLLGVFSFKVPNSWPKKQLNLLQTFQVSVRSQVVRKK